MKIFKHLIFVALTVAFFGGCQKELNFDGEASIGSLKSALTGNCNPILVNGYYQDDSTLNADNWVEVQVNTSFAGTFEIKSDTVNGFSFYRSGYVPTGLNTIRLLASGKPDTAMVTTFKVYYDTSFCTFTINVVASTVGAAHYILGGSPGACATFTPHGSYAVGTPLNAADSVTFLVNVTTPGFYNISTGMVNGMKFIGTGSFANIGIYQVTLYGSGTPTSAAAASFTVSGDGTTCTFSITPGGGGGPAAVYTLGGSPGGPCTSVTIAGTYMAGLATSASNTVRVDVNVTTVGNYSMSTTTANNVKFIGGGTFSSTGPQQVTLSANTGTPAASGPFTYTITGASTTCTFTINYAAAAPPAVFTLSGDPGLCAPATVNGTYTVGTALTGSNTVVLEVTVTTPGSYAISTNTVGGMKFTTSGLFTSTGTFPVTLAPTAGSNPTTAGPNLLTPTGNGGTMCSFIISVTGPSDRIYTFKVGTTTYTGPCSGILTTGGPPDQLSITGGSGSNIFQLTLTNETGAISTGTYSGTSMAGKWASFQYTDGGSIFYVGDPQLPAPFLTNLVATITSLDTVNGVVIGTFSGTVIDATFNFVTITNGTFKADF